MAAHARGARHAALHRRQPRRPFVAPTGEGRYSPAPPDLRVWHGAGRAARRRPARAGGQHVGDRRRDGERQVLARAPAGPPVRSAPRHGVPRRPRRPRGAPRRPAVGDRVRAAGDLPLQHDPRGQHRIRGRGPAGARTCAPRRGRGGHRAARQGRRAIRRRVPDACRRAWPHTLGRTEAAHGHRAGAHDRRAGAGLRRRAVGRGHLHGGGNPDPPAHRSLRIARPSSWLTASPRFATPTRSSSSTRAGSSSGAPTTRSPWLADPTASSCTSSSSKPSWRSPDVRARRRDPRQGVRQPAHAAADRVPAPVQGASPVRSRRHRGGRRVPAGAAGAGQAGHRSVHRHG